MFVKVVALILLIAIGGAVYVAYTTGIIEIHLGTKSTNTQTTPTTTTMVQTSTSMSTTSIIGTQTATRTTNQATTVTVTKTVTTAPGAATTTTHMATSTRPRQTKTTTTTITTTVTTSTTKTSSVTSMTTTTTAATTTRSTLPKPWDRLILPEIRVTDKLTEEGPRMLLVAAKRNELHLQPLYAEKTPGMASYSEPMELGAATGIGFLGPSYAILISTFSPIAFLDDLYLSEKPLQPFMVVFFSDKVMDAVAVDSVAVNWLLLTSNGDLVYASAEKKLSIPRQFSDKVSEARESTCRYRLYHDRAMRHVGAFSSENADIALAWGGKKLVLVALSNTGGLVAGCDEKPEIKYIKVITFPDNVVWAGKYSSNTILWVLTTKALYAIPVVSYKFQTAWLPVSPAKLRPVLVAKATSFAVIDMNGDALVLLLENGKIIGKYVENEWEGIARVKAYLLQLKGIELTENEEKPIKIMVSEPVLGDELLALQYPSSVSIYSINCDECAEGKISATREVAYSIPRGDQVIGYTVALLQGDEDHAAIAKKKYGVNLGENIYISGIVVTKADGRLIAVLDYEGR